eukprot:275256_1
MRHIHHLKSTSIIQALLSIIHYYITITIVYQLGNSNFNHLYEISLLIIVFCMLLLVRVSVMLTARTSHIAFIEGIQPKEIQIVNELNKNDIDSKEQWDFKDINDEDDETFVIKKKKDNKKKKNVIKHRVFEDLFEAAKQLESSDYKYMKDINFNDIIKLLKCTKHFIVSQKK